MINWENQRILDKDRLIEDQTLFMESKILQVMILGTLEDAFMENHKLIKLLQITI
tara:strand:- start:513 stop:677 length:165 start_codon:yes stop_codon:yes gene_type:complete